MGKNSFPPNKIKMIDVEIVKSKRMTIEIGIGCDSIRENKVSKPAQH